MYLIRRVIYAAVIVFMDEYMICGVLIVLVQCLIMLVYAL